MSEMGAFIWKLINESKNEEEVLSAILEEYDVEKEVAKNDLEEFLSKLKEFGIVE
ncbi:MAG: PqqD family protein [Eubacteriales bacterium]|nr:PqqD family protein [Eubacteriales bacterium]